MIWITGVQGMLGRELALFLEKRGVPFFGTGHETDITNRDALFSFSKEKAFDWIVNCAAYTAVDKAEDEAEKARLLNEDGPANLAETAEKRGAKLIHISTDYVFDGESLLPYNENDKTNPQCVYGKTKLAGEKKVLSICGASYILRTAWLYGEYGNNFVQTMLRLQNEKETLNVVDDQKGTPTWTRELAFVIARIIERENVPFGIYHVSGEGECSWFQFAKAIYEEGRARSLVKSGCVIKAYTSAEYPQKARRPKYALLDKTKIKNAINYNIPNWKESLNNFLEEFRISKNGSF